MATNIISPNTSLLSTLACPILPETDDEIVHAGDLKAVRDEKDEIRKELIALGSLKWRNTRSLTETAKLGDKAAKIVNVKVSPRPIQQPR